MVGNLGVEVIEQVVHRELVALIVVDDGEGNRTDSCGNR